MMCSMPVIDGERKDFNHVQILILFYLDLAMYTSVSVSTLYGQTQIIVSNKNVSLKTTDKLLDTYYHKETFNNYLHVSAFRYNMYGLLLRFKLLEAVLGIMKAN